MFRLVTQKIKNKKWLNLCLLVGISLLVAMFSCHPMFEKGAGNRILQTSFAEYAEEKGDFPAIIGRSEHYELTEEITTQVLYHRMDAYEKKWLEYIAVDAVESTQVLTLTGNTVLSNLDNHKRFLNVSCLKNLGEHTQVVDGVGLTEATVTEGAIPCVISEKLMDTYGMVVGEQLSVYYEGRKSDKFVPFEIVGIIRQSSDYDNFWNTPLTEYDKHLFVAEEAFDVLLEDCSYTQVLCRQELLLNYTQIDSEEVSLYRSYLQQFRKADGGMTTNFLTTLQNTEKQEQTAGFMLTVLELPCVILLLLFVYMVANQILQSEEGEIAVLRSRGVTRFQIIRLYLMQSALLSLCSMGPGLLLGYAMCKLGASTDGFLLFARKDVSIYFFRPQMILFGVAACGIAIWFMTIPVWKRSKDTIVEQKGRNQYENKKPLWQTLFLDVILVTASLYLLFHFQGQRETIAWDILTRNEADPMIFLNASLFLFACGLLFLRLAGYGIALVDHLGKKRWKPAEYASFLQIRRTYHRQGLLSVFLIMTISCGIFDANMARTVNTNNEERILYHAGADIQVKDSWDIQIMLTPDGQYHWEYPEPDYENYLVLQRDGSCESITRVLEDTSANVGGIVGVNLLGIHTKEFGETAILQEGLNEEHWYHALNALAKDARGAIISRNMAEALQLKVGDTTQYTRYSPIVGKEEQPIGTEKVTVCAILDAFPGYERYAYVENEDGSYHLQENYLMVVNFATLADRFGLTPYRVWMRKADGVEDSVILEKLNDAGVQVREWSSADRQITKSRNYALLQVTNGMFTMSFLISLLVCSVGFLIYWIMSIKSRELLFGVYRAMGMSMQKVNRMLINEQIFGSLLPILAGGIVGVLGSVLFAELIALVYLPMEHNIALHMVSNASDMGKLFVVLLFTVFICLLVIRRILGGMKIAEALKLGED